MAVLYDAVTPDVIPRGFFEDAVNPTDEEIVRWAYIKGAHYPPEMEQDWDLCVTSPMRADLLVRLASDDQCPNRVFFLSCLYLLVGDAVRTKGQTWPLKEVSAWITRTPVNGPKDIALFFQRSADLLDHPETFDYNKWCWHGHAYKIDDEAIISQPEACHRWWQFWK